MFDFIEPTNCPWELDVKELVVCVDAELLREGIVPVLDVPWACF